MWGVEYFGLQTKGPTPFPAWGVVGKVWLIERVAGAAKHVLDLVPD